MPPAVCLSPRTTPCDMVEGEEALETGARECMGRSTMQEIQEKQADWAAKPNRLEVLCLKWVNYGDVAAMNVFTNI